MANATIAVGNGSLLNIVKAQVVFLLSTLTEDTYERKKAEIRDLIERHGVEIHVHLLRRLIAASHSRLTLDDPSTLYVPRAVLTFLFLVQEIQRVARSPLAADCFREAVDKGEGQIFLTFDLDRFCERIGLGPLEKLVLASPIISTFASRKSLAIQASELLQNNFDRAVALIRKSPSFDQDDLPPPEVKKLLGCLLSDSPSGHPILDVQQYHSLISSVQAKIGAEAMGELLATISHTPRLALITRSQMVVTSKSELNLFGLASHQGILISRARFLVRACQTKMSRSASMWMLHL
ncbi:hypothetical protein DL93DRAFT_723414 [Clavulina sp. PMI_390]|nr:hypothetical protein DL93DRAFT_723414 [Clavulina sp. PMI_390]